MPEPSVKLRPWPRCMDPGPLRIFVTEFTNHLADLRYTRVIVQSYEDAACHFAEWVQRSGTSLADVDETVLGRFARHRCKCTGIRRHKYVSAKYTRRVRRFAVFLAQKGTI